jgi:hypothetical protein
MNREKRKNKRNGHKAAHVAQFLKAVEKCGLIKEAARAVGLSHSNHFHWLASVPGYAERFAAAMKVAEERVGPQARAELISRAIEGEKTLVIDRGSPVEVWVNPAGEIVAAPDNPKEPGDLKRTLYWEVKKSDTLLQFLLKSLYPDEFGDRQKLSLTGANGGPVQTETNHKFDHARFADLFRSRFGGVGSGDGAAPTNGN